ncbi:MAG: sulfatase-like hydrolase/transferase [Pyrinomonadaceae bacterium]
MIVKSFGSLARSHTKALRPDSSTSKPLVSVFLLASWFGLLTGLAEVFILGTQKFLFHQTIGHGPEIVWMEPAANLFNFAVVGVILLPVSRLWPMLAAPRLITSAFAFLAAFSVLFMFHPQLHKYAAMLLAVGLAVQTCRLVTAHADGFRLLMRRTIWWMAAVVAGLTVSFYGWQLVSEQRALAKLPSAAANAPNVLLIVLDTVRAQNLSLYGYGRSTTPQLERLAQGGVRFDRALSTAPWTLPSHASMFTGRYPHEVSANWLTPLDATHPTLAEVLSARGYLTAGFVANTGYGSYEHGLNRGFVHYEDFFVSPGAIISSSSLGRYIADSRRLRRVIGNYQTLGRKSAAKVNRDFLRWLSQKDERPFFVFLNYYDAHAPYVPHKPFNIKFGLNKPVEPNPLAHKKDVNPQEIQAMIDGYDSSIAYLDQQLGLLFDELKRRRILENTLVIITSDHGEEFGEHDLFDHGNTLYLPSVHVPLLILFPERVPAGSSSDLVTLRDLPATVTDLLQLDDEVSFPGSSLARYWCSACESDSRQGASPLLSEVNYARNVPPWLPVSKGDMKSLIIDSLRYVKNGDGREEALQLK